MRHLVWVFLGIRLSENTCTEYEVQSINGLFLDNPLKTIFSSSICIIPGGLLPSIARFRLYRRRKNKIYFLNLKYLYYFCKLNTGLFFYVKNVTV
jgi:hypothetical protein